MALKRINKVGNSFSIFFFLHPWQLQKLSSLESFWIMLWQEVNWPWFCVCDTTQFFGNLGTGRPRQRSTIKLFRWTGMFNIPGVSQAMSAMIYESILRPVWILLTDLTPWFIFFTQKGIRWSVPLASNHHGTGKSHIYPFTITHWTTVKNMILTELVYSFYLLWLLYWSCLSSM